MHPSKFMGLKVQTQAPAMSEAERDAKLEALGQMMAGKRKEAVDARIASGIEDVWMACEEAYLGIDDMNRAEFTGAKWAKPTSMSAGLTSNVNKSDDVRSTAFVRLTSRYVDGASAKLSEIILPIDDKAFMFKPSPVAELVQGLGQPPQAQPQVPPPAEPMAAMQPPQPGQPPMQGGAPDPVDPLTADQSKAAKGAEKAETRIYDWMAGAKYPREARKIIKDSARIGVGILKGPFPEVRKGKAMVQRDGAMAMEITKKIVPSLRWIDPWNFYPADGCGENIHDGDLTFEKDYLSPRKLKALKEDKSYIASQIDVVLAEGPGKVYLESSRGDKNVSKNRYEVWYCYCCISREDLETMGAVGHEDVPEDQEDVFAIVTIVNDTVIRAIINPLDSGNFPYRVASWSRRPGHWAGVGVGEKMQMPQRSVNAATRALFNNAGLSSGVQIVIDQAGIIPADGSWKLTPNKIWYKTEDGSSQRVQDSFAAIVIPSVQAEMMNIIQYGMKLAEESTGIPLITQGQTGPTSPETFGQAELQNNNSLTWLRSVGYDYDDQVTVQLVDDFYEWLLLDPNVPDDEKGDFQIDAHGSAAMVERAIQEQTMVGLLQASQNPAFDIDPSKLFKEYLKAKRMNPEKIQLSEEDKAKRAQQPPPEAPAIAVAKIRAQTDMEKTKMSTSAGLKVAQMDNQTAQEKVRVDTDRDTVMVNAQAHRDQIQGDLALQKLQLTERIETLKYANQQQISLDKAKVDIARTTMQEQTKRSIADQQVALNQSEGHKNRMTEFAKGPLEPAGRAENGKAFSQ